MKTRVIKRTMSDHNVVMTEVSGRNGTSLTPRRTCNKEMFFSNLLNEIKQKHIKFYLRYAVQMVSLVMNKDQELNTEKQKEILDELKSRLPIIRVNQPKRIYEVERKIDQLLKDGAAYERINKEIMKLRKYSFQSYVKKNLKALQINPKAYHRCIQNMIGWNLQLGPDTAINGDADLDPQ